MQYEKYYSYTKGPQAPPKTNQSQTELAPMKRSELLRVGIVLKGLFKLSPKEDRELDKILFRVDQIWQRSGSKFCIQYLSEALRLVMVVLAGKGVGPAMRISCYPSGIPRIIGPFFRDIILNYKNFMNGKAIMEPRTQILMRLITSCLAIFRAMSFMSITKFDSVTDKFTGTDLSYPEIEDALRELKLSRSSLQIGKPRILWSTRTGVNARFGFLSLGPDMLAMILNPNIWLNHIRYSWRMGYYFHIFRVIILSILFIPLIPVAQALELTTMGRLAVVKELRGKNRVVGITNGWTQILFKPLHDAIYRYLETLDADGTNDQLRPIKLLLRQQFEELVSVDLSNATDRLPVETQARILEALGIPGMVWKEILHVPYWYKDTPRVYEVGQPMGAYSSFAMLALTQHVLIALAIVTVLRSRKVRKLDFDPRKAYAILGDDTVVHPLIATAYINILEKLGVKVNPIKGFDGRIIEFAKNLIHTKGDNLSPIGGKVLLRSMREPLFLVPLFKDLDNKGILNILQLRLSDFKLVLKRMYGSMTHPSRLAWLFTLLGPQSGLWKSSMTTVIGQQVVPNYWIGIYDEFLNEMGLDKSVIANKYYKILTKRTRVSLMSILDIGGHFLRLLNFIDFPLIWNIDKFQHLRGSPRLWAALTTASTTVIVIPFIFRKFLLQVFIGLGLSGLTILVGHRNPLTVSMIENWRNNGIITILLDSFFGTKVSAEVLRMEELTGMKQQYSDATRNPLTRVPWANWPWKTDSTWFNVFLSQFFTQTPVQLLTERLVQNKKGMPIDDQLPALKTAKVVLSSGNTNLGAYFKHQKEIWILTYQIKSMNNKIKKLKLRLRLILDPTIIDNQEGHKAMKTAKRKRG